MNSSISVFFSISSAIVIAILPDATATKEYSTDKKTWSLLVVAAASVN
jgi:hypothetical protein